jgi:hypothetical protein
MEYDTLTIYCNQMGMLVQFSYCSKMGDVLPCRNIINCWHSRIDIITFLKNNYSIDELKKIFSTFPKSRIERILDSLKID